MYVYSFTAPTISEMRAVLSCSSRASPRAESEAAIHSAATPKAGPAESRSRSSHS